MLDKFENIIWICLISVLIYLLLPLVLKTLLPSYSRIIAIISVLFVNVIYVFVSSLILTKKYGFSYLYPIIMTVIFIPCSLVLYKTNTLIYCLLYIVIGLVGSLIYYKYTNKINE